MEAPAHAVQSFTRDEFSAARKPPARRTHATTSEGHLQAAPHGATAAMENAPFPPARARLSDV